MIKSEYERSYQWNPPGGEHYSKNLKNKNKFSEPIMTHKRRVKVTEDNVIIGEPLPTQNNEIIKEDPYFVLGDKTKKFHPSIPYRNMKALDKAKIENKHTNKTNYKIKKIPENPNFSKDDNRDEKKKPKKIKFISEAVQTENDEVEGQIKAKVDTSIQSIPKDEVLIEKKPKKTDQISREMKNKVSSPYSMPTPAQTEYQTKYAWREPLAKQSQEHNKTSENQSKFDLKLKIYNNFLSEYQQQFRPYEFVNENRFKRMMTAHEKNPTETHLQIIPDNRDHGRRAITPPPRLHYKDKLVASHETMNPQRLHLPHGKSKRFDTEYSANFDNKWKNLENELDKSREENEARQSNQQSKWFKEILELRKKAQEYRQRTRGTHFSREHLGEIFTKFNKSSIDDYQDNDHLSEQIDRRNNHRNQSPIVKRSKSFHHSRRIEPSQTIPNQYNRQKNSSSIEETILTPSSGRSSSGSTIVRKSSRSNSRSPEPRYLNWQQRSAGKPSFDNNLLLDEEASHDTEIKDDFKFNEPLRPNFSNTLEKEYTFQKYFNENPERSKNMRTIDYDTVIKSSSVSKMSSVRSVISTSSRSSRSLALETLERAKRNRDEIFRSKS